MPRSQQRRNGSGRGPAGTSKKPINQCVSSAARAVVVDRLDLQSAWRLAAREHGIRDLRIDQAGELLIAAIRTEAELFGGTHYGQRLADSERAQTSIAQLLSAWPVHVSGLPAMDLAPDGEALELLVYEDEAEALLRRLLDASIDYSSDQQRWSTRRDGAEQVLPAVLLGTPWMDARVSILPQKWQRLPLFQQGQAIWTKKIVIPDAS